MVPPNNVETVAAVDLGSNSFHMVVARFVREELSLVDRLRERVALAAGLDEKKNLRPDVEQRALDCIARFGERVRSMPKGSVRAVGTSALRQAKNARAFLQKAEDALGHPIEIISGAEEARIIYLGVAHDLSDDASRRLVVDIGGGSTEIILGERFETLRTDSLHMGCVNWTMRFFPEGDLREKAMEKAVLAARRELTAIERHTKALAWEDCIGSSGTILSIEAILRANQWSERGITPRGLKKLRKELVDLGRVERLQLAGLAPERAPVIAGGVAILSAIFDALEIQEMRTSQGALREGLLYDLVGRIRHEDVRDRTIKSFSERHRIDLVQAGRVQRTALALLHQVEAEWGLAGEAPRTFLGWGARLHEVGLSIAHGGYHHHGAYLVEHSDMSGFSRDDQLVLAALIDGHRRKLPAARIAALPPALQKGTLRLCLVLRLAVLLNRSRGQSAPPAVRLVLRRGEALLVFPEGWLDANPLSRADLDEETQRWREAGIVLETR
ncbi:MAG: exopolyphosphatase [Planctomycetes bacterium]|nr:exopolyphosphatase [Planctomycetota bacterium]